MPLEEPLEPTLLPEELPEELPELLRLLLDLDLQDWLPAASRRAFQRLWSWIWGSSSSGSLFCAAASS